MGCLKQSLSVPWILCFLENTCFSKVQSSMRKGKWATLIELLCHQQFYHLRYAILKCICATVNTLICPALQFIKKLLSCFLLSQDPQVVTGSHDTTIKFWDLVAGNSSVKWNTVHCCFLRIYFYYSCFLLQGGLCVLLHTIKSLSELWHFIQRSKFLSMIWFSILSTMLWTFI
jgi:hypothetical protein